MYIARSLGGPAEDALRLPIGELERLVAEAEDHGQDEEQRAELERVFKGGR